MSPPLTRVVQWGHALLAEQVEAGQLAVDLTAGNGHDTLMLYRLVGPTGQVVAFDIQMTALHSTEQRLRASAAVVRRHVEAPQPLPAQAGVDLVLAGHEQLHRYLPGEPQAVIANLGFLPGGDRRIITRPESTLHALACACQQLQVGGRLAVVVYTGHPGGDAEGGQVDRFFAELPETHFQVLRINVANRLQAPYLLVAEKRRPLSAEGRMMTVP